MSDISITKARQNLYQLVKDVNTENVPVTIINNRGKNAVLISEEDWNAIQETLYLNSIPGLADSIIEAAREPVDEMTEYKEDETW